MTSHLPTHASDQSNQFDVDPLVRSVWPFRIEDHLTDDEYVLEAELPGLHGEQDMRLSVHDGWLTVEARSPEYDRDARHSELRSGPVRRMVNLPPGVDLDRTTAIYRDGVLQVHFPFSSPSQPPKRIPIVA